MFCCVFCKSQQKEIDSLKNQLKNTKEDTAKAKLLSSISWLLINTGAYDEARVYSDKTIALSAKWPKGLSLAYSNIGYIYLYQANLQKALDYFFKAYTIDSTLKNTSAMSKELGSIGGTYTSLGDYPKALKYYFDGLKIELSSANKKGTIAKFYSNIGIVYMQQKNNEMALDYFFKAKKGFEETGGEIAASPTIGNIGVVFERMGKHGVAINYFARALKVAEETGDKYRMTLWYENMGVALEGQGDSVLAAGKAEATQNKWYEMALMNYRKALSTSTEIGDKMGMAIDNGFLGILYVKKEEYKASEQYLLKAESLADSTGALDLISEQYKNLSNLYTQTNQHKQALAFYKKYIVSRDSIFNEENTKKQTQLEMQYEFDKRQAATKLVQEKRDAVAAADARRQKIILLAVSGIGILVLFFALFAYRSYRQKMKSNIRITKQKEIIEEKQKEILDSINYASRIQRALLPSEKYFEKNLQGLQKK